MSRREVTQRALAAEQERMRHYRKALACVGDEALRRRWQHELDASRRRAAALAIELVELGEPLPVAEPRRDSSRCLLDAMEMALSNGDMPAAELVARECMALIDMRCHRVHDELR